MVLVPAETVHVSRCDTELGEVSLASTSSGVVCCSLPGDRAKTVIHWVREHLPGAAIIHGRGRNGPAIRAVQDFVAGRRHDLDLPLDLRGTDFQRSIWNALREVPYGETISYGELARRAGHPGATRACGTANNKNPVPLFVPCHRVVASDGSLGGFAGGLPLKRKLLGIERSATLASRAQAG